ncbi:MAG: hypothetical protein IPM63_14730 [Acidobacteriota bacterium]|nr:MAG: hypothetical protein IPM63_14730 [Acidobacteriota bacterium]
MRLEEPTEELLYLLSGPGTIERAQTTFIDIAPKEREGLWRIHFGIAHRRSYLRGEYSQGKISESHPLSFLYDEKRARISFHSGPSEAEAFLTDLNRALDELFEGWIDPAELMNTYFTDPTHLPPGTSGELIRGPKIAIETAVPVLERHGMRFRVFEYDFRQPSIWVMTLDRMYVVVEGFAVERLYA